MGGSGKDVVFLRRSGKVSGGASHICRTLFVEQHDRISTLFLERACFVGVVCRGFPSL